MHLKGQYFLIVAGLVLVAALPRAEAQSNPALAARIAQLEARAGAMDARIQALTTKVQALENLTALIRRNGNQLIINASQVSLRNLTLDGDLTVKGNSNLGDGGEDTLSVSASAMIGGPVSTLGDVSVGGDLEVAEDITGYSRLLLYGEMLVTGNVFVGGNSRIGGYLETAGNAYLGEGADTFVSIGGGLVVHHSAEFGASANGADFFEVQAPLVNFAMETCHFDFSGLAVPVSQYVGGFVVTDGNVVVRNTGGAQATNRRGNIVIGDALVGNGHTWGQANFGNITNSLVMGYDHWIPNVDVTGAIISGHGHLIGGSWSAALGGHDNIIGSTYGFTLGGFNNYAQRSGTGHVGGFNNSILGGNFDDWHVGVGGSEFDPN